MTEEQFPAPEKAAATAAPVPHPFSVLAYEPLMTRIKAAQLKPLFTGLLVAVGVMALGNVVMFALVQQAQQETVDFATKVAANAENGGEFQDGGDASAGRMAAFGPLADLIDAIKAKERRRDALLAQRPEFAGDLPVANAPDWRGLAAQQLSAYDDQIDTQIAMLAKGAAVASADSVAPSSLDAPRAAPSIPFPAPSSAFAKPTPMKQAIAKQSASKPSGAASSAKRVSDSSYSRELTAALNRAARAPAPAPAGAIGESAPAAPHASTQNPAAPVAASAPLEAAPIATAAPTAPPAITPASEQVGQ